MTRMLTLLDLSIIPGLTFLDSKVAKWPCSGVFNMTRSVPILCVNLRIDLVTLELAMRRKDLVTLLIK